MCRRRSAVFGVFAAFASCGVAAAQDATLTFVHVNDLDRIEARDGVGGLAKVVAVVEAERAKGGTVMFTHGGDAISPSLLSAFDQGAHMIDLLNRAGLNAFALGNHEFDFGPDVAAARIAEADFPVLANNVRGADGAPLPGVVDRVMIEIDGYVVGLFGLTTATTNVKSSPRPAIVDDPPPVAARTAAALRRAGADLVVALAHTNRAEDAALVEQGAVDVILSGDDHDLRARYAGGGPLLVESASQGDHVAVVDIRFSRRLTRAGMVVDWRPSVRFVDTASVDPDPAMAAAVQTYLDRLSDALDVPIGVTETPLDSRRGTVRRGEAAIGNLIADAMRAATDADAALTNGGGIRGHTTYAAGTTLTRRDVRTELPFGNRTVVLAVDGATLRAALEHGVGLAERPAGRFPQVSNLAVVYEPTAPAGARIETIAVAGAPLDDARVYRLATNDFIARGGDGYAMLVDAPRLIDENAGGLIAAQVIAYVEAAKTVAPKVEGRLTPADR